MKAKLIIEMPTNCYDCPFRRPSTLTYGYTCCVTLDSLKAYRSGDKIPKWCPLEPIEEQGRIDKSVISPDELESCLRGDEYDTGWDK